MVVTIKPDKIHLKIFEGRVSLKEQEEVTTFSMVQEKKRIIKLVIECLRKVNHNLIKFHQSSLTFDSMLNLCTLGYFKDTYYSESNKI